MTQRSESDGFAPPLGSASWPVSRAALTSTELCPACFAPLTSSVCARCGLDLSSPLAADLLAASLAAAEAMDERVALIGMIRRQSDAAARASADAGAVAAAPSAGLAAPLPVAPPSAGDPGRVLEPALLAPSAVDHRPAAPPVANSAAPHRRGSSVQVVLLIVGVSLLSVGAIFFLVYAFINYGILARSIIIAALTVAAFTVSTVLARRRLRVTAEGIATFAILLIYLDAYAVRANDFFGAGSADGLLYWGCTVLLAAAGFVAWHRFSGLRAAATVGFTTLPVGVGLVTGFLSEPLADADRAYLVFGAMALAALAHGLVAREARPDGRAPFEGLVERSLLLGTAVFSVALAGMTAAVVAPESLTLRLLAFVGVAAIAAVHVALLLRRPPRGARGWVGLFAVAVGTAVAVTGFVAVLHSLDIEVVLILPALVAVPAALGFDFLRLRAHAGVGFAAGVAAWSAAAVAAVALAAPLLASLGVTAVHLGAGVTSAFASSADERLIKEPENYARSVAALGISVALAVVAWGAGRLLRRRAGLVCWSGAVVLVLAVPLLGSLLLLVSGWLALGVAALTTLLRIRASTRARVIRPPLAGLLIGATAVGWVTAWAGEWTWIPAALVTVTIAIVARRLASGTRHGTAIRAALAGAAVGLIVLAVAAVPTLLLDPDSALPDALRFATLASAAVLVAGAAAPSRLASEADRRALFWTAIATGGVTMALALVVDPARLLPHPSGSLLTSAVLLVALLVFVLAPGTRSLRIERIVASIAVAPTLTVLLEAFADAVAVSGRLDSLSAVTAALLVSAGSLAAALLREPTVPRGLREIGVGIVAVPALVSAGVSPGPTTWLALELGGVSALLLAVSRDGLFASRSPRKHFGWAAIVLVTAGLWWRLGDDEVQRVEAYVLPVAGLLLLVALLIWRADRQRMTPLPQPEAATSAPPRSNDTAAAETVSADTVSADTVSAGRAPAGVTLATPAALVALAGLLVAVLPIASAAAADGASPFAGSVPVRAVTIGAASALLLLIGAFVPAKPGSLRPFLDAAALAGAVGVVVTAVGRAVFVAADRPRAVEIDAWLAFASAVLVVAAFGLARLDDDAVRRQRSAAGVTLAVVALTSVTAVEAWVISRTDGSLLRPLTVVLLLCAVHVLAFLVSRAPLTVHIAWLSIAYAALVAAVGVGSGALDPLELGSVPIAIGLIATGTTRLDARRDARSWPWLGPGVAVLLIPSLLATVEDRPLWRLVGIGVVGVAVIVISVVRRLQAPFTIGVLVVLVHASATFAPQIRDVYESVEWWLWLGVGGVILIVLAVRYEQRLQNLRSAVGRYSALR